MKTVLVSVDGEVPEGLRAIVERGSTAVVEYLADELAGAPRPDADRIVLWGEGEQPALRALAEAYARGGSIEDRDSLLFVRDAGANGPVAPDQLFVWPRDEDRLKLVFLTGA